MNQRQEIDAEIAVVRALLGEAGQLFSRSASRDVEELLANDEPNEALLVIAWELESQSSNLPEGTVRRIREATRRIREATETRATCPRASARLATVS
jgi:hypothetical protein